MPPVKRLAKLALLLAAALTGAWIEAVRHTPQVKRRKRLRRLRRRRSTPVR